MVGVSKLWFPTFLVKLGGASAENKHTALDILHFPDLNFKKLFSPFSVRPKYSFSFPPQNMIVYTTTYDMINTYWPLNNAGVKGTDSFAVENLRIPLTPQNLNYED